MALAAPLRFLLRPAVLNGGAGAAAGAGAGAAAAAADGAEAAAAALRARIQDLYVAHVTADGVDYGALAGGAAFADYCRAAEAVGGASVAVPAGDAARTAFFVNLYNALTIHAFAVLGPPAENSVSRLLFNARASYRVGGLVYSLTDLENGVLRRNQGVALWPPPFAADDPRLALCVSAVDPRIHFVLNCGAQSCPPIRFLQAESVEDDLALATRAFLSRRDNFTVHAPGGDDGLAAVDAVAARDGRVRVVLSAIFRWYRVDFDGGDGEPGVLRFIAENAAPSCPHAAALRRILDGQSLDAAAAVSVSYAPYDWSLNSMKAV